MAFFAFSNLLISLIFFKGKWGVKIVFTLHFLFLTSVGYTQVPTLEWATAIADSGKINMKAMTVDNLGNVYSTGSFKGIVDFDPGIGVSQLVSVGASDIFIQKIDANGKFIWAQSLGNPLQLLGRAISTDNFGNIYLTGTLRGQLDVDPGPGVNNLTSNGLDDIFILKLDSAGNFIWAKSMGSSDNDWPNDITIDNYGNVYSVGVFRDTLDADPGSQVNTLLPKGGNDIYIQKLDVNGNLKWVKYIAGPSDESATSVSLDPFGNIYIGGNFIWGPVDFNPGPDTSFFTAHNQNIFILKLDTSGAYKWVYTVGNTAVDHLSDLNTDQWGNIYSTGYFGDTVDFDAGPGIDRLSAQGIVDAFIHKINPDGQHVWAKSLSGNNTTVGYGIALDSMGNVYSTGFYTDTVDFDPGRDTFHLTSSGLRDGYVQKLNKNGQFVWTISLGATNLDDGAQITTDSDGNAYSIGHFSDTVDFAPGMNIAQLISNHGHGGYIQKLKPCISNNAVDTILACDSIQWIDGHTYSSSTNTEMHLLTNVAGCDSTVRLDLRIKHSSSSIYSDTSCNSYTWIDGNTYTFSNNAATHIVQNSVGCDSIITLDLTINAVSDTTTSTSGDTIQANNSKATYVWLNCDSNYAIIQGETSQLYVATASGNYAVQLTENGCVDTSACVAITFVGVIESSFEEDLTLYPNPTSGEFTIQFGSEQEKVELKVLDATGKLVDKQTFQSISHIEYSLDKPEGLYLIEVSDGNSQPSIIRLIKD